MIKVEMIEGTIGFYVFFMHIFILCQTITKVFKYSSIKFAGDNIILNYS